MPLSVGRLFTAAIAFACGTAGLINAQAGSTCAARAGTLVHWVSTVPPNERAAIDRWCAGVGPPARINAVHGDDDLSAPFVIASWNTHVGAGNLDGFVDDLRSGRLTGTPVTRFVLLLQEVYRTGRDVPAAPRGLSWASAQQPLRLAGPREDIVTMARRLGLDAVYVPSMRNGAPAATAEDRGNAILSTVPLGAITAIELPLERQRRVAIQADVRVRSTSGDLPLTIVDTHFTNMVMHHLWVLSESGRLRQARALTSVLPKTGPLVVGGDFNAWFGFHDAAFRELARIARPADAQDRRASFGPLRLDHVLFRLPSGWRTTLRRTEQRYGSDHYPLVATIEPPAR